MLIDVRLVHLARFLFKPSLAHEPGAYWSQMKSDALLYAVLRGGESDFQMIKFYLSLTKT